MGSKNYQQVGSTGQKNLQYRRDSNDYMPNDLISGIGKTLAIGALGALSFLYSGDNYAAENENQKGSKPVSQKISQKDKKNSIDKTRYVNIKELLNADKNYGPDFEKDLAEKIEGAEEKLSERVEKYSPFAERYGPGGEEFGVREGIFRENRLIGMIRLAESIREIKAAYALSGNEMPDEVGEDLEKAEKIFSGLAVSYESGLEKTYSPVIERARQKLDSPESSIYDKKEAAKKGLRLLTKIENADPSSMKFKEELESLMDEFRKNHETYISRRQEEEGRMLTRQYSFPSPSVSEEKIDLDGLLNKPEGHDGDKNDLMRNYLAFASFAESVKDQTELYGVFKLDNSGNLEVVNFSERPSLIRRYSPLNLETSICINKNASTNSENYRFSKNEALGFLAELANKKEGSVLGRSDGSLFKIPDGDIDSLAAYSYEGWREKQRGSRKDRGSDSDKEKTSPGDGSSGDAGTPDSGGGMPTEKPEPESPSDGGNVPGPGGPGDSSNF